MPQVDLQQACDLSIVIPVLNEQESVVPLWHEIRDAVKPTGLSFEVIFVDDGSGDASAAKIQELCAGEPRVKLARFVRNFGQTAAMSAGIELACGRVIVPLDADRQNDPASIPDLVNELKKGYDVVSGWRRERQDGALLRRLPSVLANRLIGRVTGVRLHDFGCSMKAYKAEFIKDIRLYGQMHRFIPVYAAHAGARIGEIEVRHRPRTAGQSKYGIDRTLRVILDLIVVQLLHKYRSRPMHLFGRLAYGLFGAGALAWFVGAIGGTAASDLRFLLMMGGLGAVMFGLGGVTVAVGLVAELVTRAHFEILGQRPYAFSSLTNFDATQAHPRSAASAGAKPAPKMS